MMRNLTRSKAIQIWFVAVALIAVAAIALGATLSMGRWALILGMCLVPPAMLFKLWPSDVPDPSIRDMSYDSKPAP